jgi:hypothetical protein
MMKSIKRFMRRSGSLVTAAVFGVALVAVSVAPSGTVNAATLTSRKLTMDSNNISGVTTDANGASYAAGTFFNGSSTKHTFTFNLASTQTPQGMSIMYCTTPLPQTTCTAPTGLTVSSQTGSITTTGFATSNTWTVNTAINAGAAGADYFATGSCSGSGVFRQNCILLTNASVGSTTSGTSITVPIGNGTNGWVTNPSSAQNFYVRIQLFSGTSFTNAQTTGMDQGSVAGEVYDSVQINSAVQESLNFSVGSTYVAPSTTCAAITGTGVVGLGDSSGGVYLLSNTAAKFANSWWRLSTNASNGVNVYYRGNSLKNAAGDTISTSTTAWTPVAGTERFGLTMDSGDGNHSFTNLTSTAPYTSATQYAFDTASTTIGTPAQLASASAGTTVNCDTAVMKYVGSISTTTKPGIYKTNLIYYAVPTF